jgi:hypothetical protein
MVNRYRSTSPWRANARTNVALPATSRSRPGGRLSAVTASMTPPDSSFELFHAAVFSVYETTNLGMLFIRSANSSSSVIDAQAAAYAS